MSIHPHVVIVGGGFGGLSVARGLAGAKVRVTLVDRRTSHRRHEPNVEVAYEIDAPAAMALVMDSIAQQG